MIYSIFLKKSLILAKNEQFSNEAMTSKLVGIRRRRINKLLKQSIIKFIGLYQKTLSPDHGWFRAKYPYGACRFYPTCSDYAKTVINEKSLILAIFLIIKRLLNCHPWANSKHYN